MGKSQKIAFWGGLAFVIIAGFVMVGTFFNQESDRARRSVKIAVSQTPLSAPFLIAQNNKLFKKQGIDVSLISCFGGVACAKSLFDGQVDFATASESVVMFQSFKHDDIRLIASFVESDNDLKLLALKNQNIHSIQDLDGKRVGVIKASASEFYLDSILIANNVTDMEYTKVYLPPQELMNSLLSYQLDAISIWEPYGYKTTISSASDVTNLGLQGIYQLSFNLISRQQLIAELDDETHKILSALDEAISWIQAHPEEARAIIARQLDVPANQLKWSWDDYVFRLSLGNALLTNLQLQARWAIEKQLVPNQQPDYRSIFASKPFEDALDIKVKTR
ncbi:ABC transporter substrate-binding protein [Vibrio sp. AK197]